MNTEQLDRIEAKLDQLLALSAEMVAFKAEIEEAIRGIQSGGMLAMMGKMLGK